MPPRWVVYAVCAVGLPVYLWGLDGARHVGGLPADIPTHALHYPVLVNGAAAASPDHLRSLVEQYEPGRTIELTRDGATQRVQVVPLFTGAHLIISALAALLFWAVACFVFAAWPDRDPGHAFFFSTFSYGLAVAAGTEAFPADPHGLAALRPVLRTLALAFTPAFFVMLTLLFPRRHPSVSGRRWVLPVLFAAASAIAAWRAAVLLGYFGNPTATGWREVVASDRVIGVFVAVLVAVGFTIMYRSGRRAELTREKRQLKWVWWGISVGTSPFVFLYALPHALFGEPLVPLHVTRAAAIVVPIALAVAAVRYQLLDIDIIIRRSIIYGAMAAAIAAIYLIVVETAGRQIARFVPGAARHIPLVAAFVAVALYRPTRKRVGRWVDRTFFHIRHSHARALTRFRSAVARPRGQEDLADFTRRFLKRILGLKSVTVALRVRSKLVAAGEADGSVARAVLERLELAPDPQGLLLAAPGATSVPEVETDDYPPELVEAAVPLVQPVAAYGRLQGLILAGEKVAERCYIEEDLKLIAGVASAAAEACERLALARGLAEERIGREHLDELNRMKSEFLSRVAHDLRTPVTSIDWSARNLLDELAGPLSPSQAAYMQSILISAILLGRLVNNLLEISRLEQGDHPIVPEPVDLAAVADEAADCLMPIAATREVRIVRRMNRALGPARGQREKLVQVAVNLLQNAIRFSPRCGEIELVLEHGEEGVQRLAVRDSGPGIRPGEEESIFGQFRQGVPSPHEPVQGFGLGLYVVRAHVETLGGRVVAANRRTGGAEFIVSLADWPATAEGRT